MSKTTLLPVARVDVFALDAKTAKTAEALVDDWRFARVDLHVDKDGGMKAAIDRYAERSSPDLVIIETNDMGDALIEQLAGLAEYCDEGTDAVIIGPTNDVHLYRELIAMGVKDYLVRPVSSDDFIDVISQILVEKKGLSDSRIIAVLGSKGGVGATTVAQLMAWEISEDLGQKTIFMDAAGGWGSFGISFGVDAQSPLSEALKTAAEGSDDDMERMYQKYSDNLTFLATGGDPMLENVVDADDVENAMDRILKTYPVLVIDLSGSTPDIKKRVLERAHETILVTAPTLPALRGARALLSEIKTLRGEDESIDLVVNMQGIAGNQDIPKSDMKAALDFEPGLIIPFNAKIFATAEATGTPVAKSKEGKKIAQSLMALAQKSSDYQSGQGEKGHKKASFLDKILGKK